MGAVWLPFFREEIYLMKISNLLISFLLLISLGMVFSMVQTRQQTASQIKETNVSPKKADKQSLDKRYRMAYLSNDILAPNPHDYFSKSINTAGKALNEVSPPYFTLNLDGTLKETNISRPFIAEMHKKSIQVVPYLSDQWDKEKAKAALKNQKKLVSQITKAVKEYNLDGVNVDIEHVTAENRSDYSHFVKLLRSKLPKSKKITVAVAANPKGWTGGWQGAYDDAALAKSSDYLMLMAYDEHFQDEKSSGPVASLSFVENSIEYLQSQHVPSSKIVLGIPFYGRIWKSDGTINGLDVSLKMTESLIKKYHAKVVYNKKFQSPLATFTIKKKDDFTKLTKWDKTLTPGTYTIWYENEDSIKAKLGLVKKYNLKGSGVWSLGQETKDTWSYFGKWPSKQ